MANRNTPPYCGVPGAWVNVGIGLVVVVTGTVAVVTGAVPVGDAAGAPQAVSTKISVNSVEEILPPITTAAIGLRASEPALVPSSSGSHMPSSARVRDRQAIISNRLKSVFFMNGDFSFKPTIKAGSRE